MPMLGFTVFIDKILDGSKTQTIRKMRETPIKLGDILYLYAYPRTKNTKLLGVTYCQSIDNMNFVEISWIFGWKMV